MPQNLPLRAIDSRFSSEVSDPDEEGVYRVVEYKRRNNTLYMRSKLSVKIGKQQYRYVTLTFFDESGTVPLNSVVWELDYDIDARIVSKKVT